ncbi:MAG: flagellar basal body rod protein FlgC [Planctomycetaceae bacterium]
MSFGRLLSSTDISASGLAAERVRMEIAANNIANVHTTSTAEGGPYRRQQVAFASAMNASLGNDAADGLAGVMVKGISRDTSELPKIFNPGHPDADSDGFVSMPNVKLPMEMVDLMTASRAYDANLKSLTTFRKMAEQSLSLMDVR